MIFEQVLKGFSFDKFYHDYLQGLTVNSFSVIFSILLILSAGTMSACDSASQHNNTSNLAIYKTPGNKISSQTVSQDIEANKQSNEFYHTLLAQLYQQQNLSLLASDHYLLATQYSTDKALLSTTTSFAARVGKTNAALDVAKRWVKNAPESLEAKQYLVLLLLRTDQFVASAKELEAIRDYVAKDAKDNKTAEQFIARMLEMETRSEQAYLAYQAYLNAYADQLGDDDVQQYQQRTLASLAMKAKKYKAADTALKSANSAESLLTRSKALHKLGRTSESVTLLKPLMEIKQTSDVIRFEYVRFLILSDNKSEAIVELKKLVDKHPDNKDLLKSLVALKLDQKLWDSAQLYANKLLNFKEYKSDAKHFLGEIHEARGDTEKALNSYLQVIDGTLKNSAQLRIPELIEKQQGLAAARLWLHQQRHKLVTIKKQTKLNLKTQKIQKRKKASLYKLEADLLFATDTADKAMEYYQRAVVLDPKNTGIRYGRGLVYERQGKIALAETDFKFILKIDNNDSSTLNALGYMLTEHTQRFDEALALINKALLISPNDAAINDSLGWLYFRRGETKTAERYLRKAYDGLKVPEVASHLIEVLQKQGRTDEAQIILKQMLKKFPKDETLKQVEQGF